MSLETVEKYNSETDKDGTVLQDLVVGAIKDSQGLNKEDEVNLDETLENLDLESIDIRDVAFRLEALGIDISEKQIQDLWNGHYPVQGGLSGRTSNGEVVRKVPLAAGEELPKPTVRSLIEAARTKYAPMQIKAEDGSIL